MFAKLMSRITESSLMEEEIPVRYVFIMLLAIADPKGYVIGTDVAIARRINVPVDMFKKAAAALQEPDPDSNSQEHEGRRVLPSDGERGYWIVNYRKYRETRDEEQRREYMKDYMRRKRNSNAGSDVAALTPGKQREPQLAHAEGEEEGELKAKTNTPPEPTPAAAPAAVVKVSDALPITPEAKFCADLYGRRHTTAWSPAEVRAFRAARSRGAFTEENMAALKVYYAQERKKGKEGIHRRDMSTFLNNIEGEIDRANQNGTNNSNAAPVSAHNNNLNRNAVSDYRQIRKRVPVGLDADGQGNPPGDP